MKKNIRSQYIKNLLEDKDSLKDQLKEVTKETLKNVIDEDFSHNLRKLISEADEEPEEDEVDTQASDDMEDSSEDSKFNSADMEGHDSDEEDDDDSEMWASLEQYKDENGEYDLTGMGKDAISFILSKMSPEEGVHVVKNDDGTASVSSDEDDTEFVIDIDDDAEDDFNEENGIGFEDEDEDDFEDDDDEDFDDDDEDSEIDSDAEYEISSDDSDEDDDDELGEGVIHDYMDDYQHVSAMDIDSNDETAPNKHKHMDWDKGVRKKGTGKRWVGPSNMSPYSEKVSEGTEYDEFGDDEYENEDESQYDDGAQFEDEPMGTPFDDDEEMAQEGFNRDSFELVFEDVSDVDGALLTDSEDMDEPGADGADFETGLEYEDDDDDEGRMPAAEASEDFDDEYEDDDEDLDYLPDDDFDAPEPEESIHTVAQNGPHRRGTTKSWAPDTSRSRHIGRNYSVAGTHRRGTGEASYQGVGESVKRKINNALSENRQLKKIAKQFQDRLNEQVVITSSLGKIVKLVTENSTSRDEKLDIVRRFNNARSVNETERIYESIDRELKKTVRNSNPMSQNKVNISEAKNRNNIVETQMYQSNDLSNTISLMNRLDKIK